MLLHKLLSPAIGLAAEAIAHKRNKSATRASSAASDDTDVQISRSSSRTFQQSEPSEKGRSAYDSVAEEKVLEEQADEIEWELDELGEEANAAGEPQISKSISVPKGNVAGPAMIKPLVESFARAHPLPVD